MRSLPRRLGKYELEEPIGRGGMAEVWKAVDRQLRRPVAIKLMHMNLAADSSFVLRFTREAQTIAALRHPNIVQIYDFHIAEESDHNVAAPDELERTVASTPDVADGPHGPEPAPEATEATVVSDGGAKSSVNAPANDATIPVASIVASESHGDSVAYMVMEYIPGQTLARYIGDTSSRQRFPSGETIIRLLTPLSLALDYAHQQGTIHRDIKPSNILLDQRNVTRTPMGEPVLTDFGLAKLLAGASQTMTGSTLGTPFYMSPEQIQNQTLGAESDIYSLGVTVYEMVTGRRPFQADSMAGLMMLHITEPPPDPRQFNSQLPAALTPVLLKSLAKNPRDRYHSAAAFTAAIAQAFDLPVPAEVKPALTAQGEATPDDTPARDAAGLASSDNAANAPTVADSAHLASRSEHSGFPAARAHASSQPPIAHRRRLIYTVALVCLLLASATGAFAFFHRSPQIAPASAPQAVGQAFFVSSGQVNQAATEGVNDEFQINLSNIPAPQSGKGYYAWLLPDASQSEAPDILLGKLTVTHGTIHYLYKGNRQHVNLLNLGSRFLITEEDANTTPAVPSPDPSTWRYYATFPQQPGPGQKFGLFDHLRHLLSDDPDLKALQLRGGLMIWTFRETQQEFQWALSVRENYDVRHYTSLHTEVVAMLDYLDGIHQVSHDLPPGTPIRADAHVAQAGLLEFDPTQEPPGYLSHIARHLNGVTQSPGATADQRAEAAKIDAALGNITQWLQRARGDAAQLAKMTTAQLQQPATLAIINDLVTSTTNAYQGHVDPATNAQQAGVSQLYQRVEQLAVFSVLPYKK